MDNSLFFVPIIRYMFLATLKIPSLCSSSSLTLSLQVSSSFCALFLLVKNKAILDTLQVCLTRFMPWDLRGTGKGPYTPQLETRKNKNTIKVYTHNLFWITATISSAVVYMELWTTIFTETFLYKSRQFETETATIFSEKALLQLIYWNFSFLDCLPGLPENWPR